MIEKLMEIHGVRAPRGDDAERSLLSLHNFDHADSLHHRKLAEACLSPSKYGRSYISDSYRRPVLANFESQSSFLCFAFRNNTLVPQTRSLNYGRSFNLDLEPTSSSNLSGAHKVAFRWDKMSNCSKMELVYKFRSARARRTFQGHTKWPFGWDSS